MLILTVIIMIFGAEVFGYIITDYKLKEINENAIEEIQNNGGYTEEIKYKVNGWIVDQGLKKYDVKVTEYPASELDWQEPFNFKVEGTFTFRAINVFGTGIGNLDVPLSAGGIGASQVYPH